MKIRLLIYLLLLLVFGFTSCQNKNISDRAIGKTHEIINSDLSVDDFEKELQTNPSVQLIDVRTTEEFEQEHLQGAINCNINASEFEQQIVRLDKNKPVLVYCLSGGRSASAASIFEQKGFIEIHNMRGGLLKWKAENKPQKIAYTKKTEKKLPLNNLLNF